MSSTAAPVQVTAHSPATRRLRARQTGVLAQLSAICLINYMDRTTLAIANPAIRHDLGVSVAQMGLLLSAFPLTYALAQLPLGPVIDRLGARKLLGAGLALWSVAQGLAGLAGSATQLLATRVLLGIGEAPTMPCCTKVVRRWFNARERGTPVGVFTGANHLGQAIAAPALTVLMVWLGWRWMFAIMGLLGMACVLAWVTLYRDPKAAGLSQAEQSSLVEGDAQAGLQPMTFARWRGLFRFRTSWGLFLGVFGSSYMGSLFATWLPGYLEMDRHLSVAKAGLVVTGPYTFAVIGSLFAGWAADMLARRGISPFNSGRIPFIVGLVGMALFTVLAAEAGGLVMAVIWLCCAMFFSQLSGSCSWVAASAAVPEDCLGSFGGIQNCFGYVGGAIAPAVTGFAVQATGSFVMPLVIGAGVSVVAAAIYWLVPRQPLQEAEIAAAG